MAQVQTFGQRWKTTGPLSEGGQAHLFRVQDSLAEPGDTREYALKRLKNVDSQQRKDRFRREASILQGIDHPNVVRVIDVNLDAAKPFIVTELHEGSLASQLNQVTGFSLDRKLALFHDVCRAMEHVHRLGIVHRDIKPENILWASDGRAVVADFGLAYVEGGERHTMLGEAVGGRNFMAPELEDGFSGDVAPSADVYAMGKLLYWLLSDGRVFSREKHRQEENNLVRYKSSDNKRTQMAIAHLYSFLDRSIVESLDRRFGSAKEALREFEQVLILIKGHFPPVGMDVPHVCRYCGIGVYKAVLDGQHPVTVQNFGLNPKGSAHTFFALQCSHCSHLELFRTSGKPWWGPPPAG